MLEIHLSALVIEDCILYNLPNAKGYVLDNGIVKQGTLGSHFTHISRQNDTRCDEVMSYLGNVGQMCGLEVYSVLFTVEFPVTVPVGQHPKDIGVVGLLMEPIKELGVNRF